MKYKQTGFKNPYLVRLLFKPHIYKHINESYISPRVKEFFRVREIDNAVEFGDKECITDLNFYSADIKYFYKFLLKNIKKEKETIILIQYSVTYDKKLTVLECDKTGMFYNELSLGNKPILYYIYFDLQEILDVVRDYALDN